MPTEKFIITQFTIDELRTAFREELEDYHRNKNITKAPTDKSADLLTIEEAASFLRLSKNYLYILVHKKSIPFIKRPGTRRIYFSKAKLTAYLTHDDHNAPSDGDIKPIEFLSTRKRQRSK